MMKLDVLRLFVEQRLSAVTDDIFRRLARTITEYDREVSRLKQEIDRQRRLLEDRALDRPRDTTEESAQGVLQVRGQSLGVHIKQEESGASGAEELGAKFTPSPDWLRETPETDQSPSSNQIQSCGKEVGRFTAEEEQQVRGWGFSLHIKQEEGGSSALEETDAKFAPIPDWLTECNDDNGSPCSNRRQPPREDSCLMRPAPEGICTPADHNQSSAVQSESSTEDSDNTQSEPAPQGTRGTRPPVDQRLLVCGSCGREFSSKRTLRKHIRRNTSQDQDRMSCSLRRQMAPFQSPAKSFSCRVCGSSFYTQGILVRHAENHCKEPENRCGACGDHLESTETLRDHLRSHKEVGSTCDVCGRKCSSIRRMEIHKRVHTGEKPYRCGFCGRDFSRKESLERHLKVHSGDRLHYCGLCRRTFTRREYLVQHLETDHMERPGPPAGTEWTERTETFAVMTSI
ncbi:zinc finger protein 691-like [Epinephelus moara]|uniref:zinc finger protein 691-like n=1 Tax=Epinephelus moara TaxID=300413 RepID=UPI00214E1710|nr:zinc finger protein 691-like [Epinephelus moara]